MKAGPKPPFIRSSRILFASARQFRRDGDWKYADDFAALIANPKTFFYLGVEE